VHALNYPYISTPGCLLSKHRLLEGSGVFTLSYQTNIPIRAPASAL
jgi:hypothetical protein